MNKDFQTFIEAYSRIDIEDRSLGGDFVLCPPNPDFGYQSTPRNALTFSKMGVDGVHTAILRINGEVRDDSPVVYVSPMDSEDVFVLAGSFVSFLAEGSKSTTAKIESLFAEERSGKAVLERFLTKRFRVNPLLEKSRIVALKHQFGHLIERKMQTAARESRQAPL